MNLICFKSSVYCQFCLKTTTGFCSTTDQSSLCSKNAVTLLNKYSSRQSHITLRISLCSQYLTHSWLHVHYTSCKLRGQAAATQPVSNLSMRRKIRISSTGFFELPLPGVSHEKSLGDAEALVCQGTEQLFFHVYLKR